MDSNGKSYLIKFIGMRIMQFPEIIVAALFGRIEK